MSEVGLLCLVDDVGVVDSDGIAWLRAASHHDRRLLTRARGPVLDVGCGPGRHVRALHSIGVDVLGIDVTPSMVETASDLRAPVVAASVFDPLPRMGQWQTALLLDGNSGLGADPAGLLRRLRRVLRPDGRVLADLLTGPQSPSRRLRLRHEGRLGPDFAWSPLHHDDVGAVAGSAGFEIVDMWEGDQRWFCELAATTTGTNLDLPRAV